MTPRINLIKSVDQNEQSEFKPQRPETIPPHVWSLLEEAGERAAERLRDIIAAPSFPKLKPSDQRQLIELALTRAYGLPVKREVSVNLSSSDGDAVAASIAALGDALTLPERRRASPPRDVTPARQRDEE